MEIINNLFGNICELLPQREYALLTGEYRSQDHRALLGEEQWDPDRVTGEARFVHFSDYPFPKPWEESTMKKQQEAVPKCEVDQEGREDCRARDIWVELYRDFKMRRKVCFSWFVWLLI
jgi:hypothetical protein